MDDIKRVVKNCEVCQRHARAVTENHPARTIQVNSIFDTLHMDLVFGFPTSKDGYNGLENHIYGGSNWLVIYPIKTKSMSEIATNYWHTSCMFGPAKVLITDNGHEFKNQLLEALCQLQGVERRFTSNYFPRSNGKNEKVNSTVVAMLRKYAENDHLNWPKWIPYINYCYNTRIHSTTDFSPYEMVFGLKANTFEYNGNEPGLEEIAQLEQRKDEIRKLVDVTRKTAFDNVLKKQEKQKQIQDSQHKIRKERLELGTRVNLKTEGLLTKLQPRYHGPYKVIGHTESGNYKLEDSTCLVMAGTYPLEKIKVLPNIVNNEDKTSFEIDKIIDQALTI